ncbi:MAG: TldD/PmbA family protein [Caldisericia bacterium]|nr:TldD/PmbA family protein [Caldisericia bacterium]
MRGKDEIIKILRKGIDVSKVDEIELLYLGKESTLTRFANNTIHQNVKETNSQIRVRVIKNKKIGFVETNNLTEEGVIKAVKDAEEIAEYSKEDPDFVKLPEKDNYIEIKTFYEENLKVNPEDLANKVSNLVKLSEKYNLIASGALSLDLEEYAILNSRGIEAYSPYSSITFSTVIMSENSSGYGDRFALRFSELNEIDLAEEVIYRVLMGKNPIDLEPNKYEVILTPYAVEDILFFFAYLSFGAKSFHQDTSFMSGKLGEKVFGENITIWDDGLDPSGAPIVFDFEGVSKKRVNLIENGIAKGVVYDSYHAFKYGKENTGHSLPQPNSIGPFALNLFMKEGESNVEDMIKNVKKGVFVSRFHYTNPLDPKRVIITGMTRDGTFLIEDGKITTPVKNMRFTQNMVELMNNVVEISKERKVQKGGAHVSVVPYIRVKEFNFTGKTEF